MHFQLPVSRILHGVFDLMKTGGRQLIRFDHVQTVW